MSSTSEIRSCRLVALPAELRNRIYRLVLVLEDPILVTNIGFKTSEHDAQEPFGELPLLRTCRHVHHEALAVFYGGNIFEPSRLWSDCWEPWLKALSPEKRLMLRQLRARDLFVNQPKEAAIFIRHKVEGLARRGIVLEKDVLFAETFVFLPGAMPKRLWTNHPVKDAYQWALELPDGGTSADFLEKRFRAQGLWCDEFRRQS